jgi:hypothetical protein
MAFLAFCGKSAPESWHPEKAKIGALSALSMIKVFSN